MQRQLSASSRRLTVALALVLSLGAAPALAAQESDEELRARAFQMFREQQYIEALPILEKLAAKFPSDGGVLARLGFAVLARTNTVKDAESRKAERARARATLMRAKELGFDPELPAELLNMVIASIPPDGSEREEKFSENPQADEAMRAGEAAFVKGDFDAAVAAYERALRLDPQLYEAPLFAGDAYLKKQEFAKAGESYARAARINPDRETAYRYWGNALLREAKLDEAREKYAEAVIADPYNSYVWRNGLVMWADKKGVKLGHPKIGPPAGVSHDKDNKVTITIDPNSLGRGDGSDAWVVYGGARAAWSMNNYERFRKEHPEEKTYRHSLAEEAEALRAVAELVKQQTKEGKVKQLNPALAELVKLHDAGLLEAYVLLARADQGIARDYAAYRRANRDKLRRYLIEYVASGKY